jgi:peroxiredoxin
VVVAVVIATLWYRRPALPLAAPAVDIVSIRGDRVALNALKGKVVLVNFWATSCAVCLKEMPRMVNVYQTLHGRGLEAVFVAMPYDRPDHVLAYATKSKLPFTVALDVQGDINRGFGGVKLTPTTFIIDKRGMIVERVVGEPDFTRLHALLERKLGEPG